MAEGQEPTPTTPPAGQDPAGTPADPGKTPEGGSTEPKGGQEPQGKQPETFDREYVERLRNEAAANRTKAREAESKLEEIEDRDRSEKEKAEKKASRAEERAAAAEAKLLRFEVASDKKVPAEFHKLLTASDREGLEEQADLIVEKLGAGESPPNFKGGPRDPAPEPKSPEQGHNDLLVGLFGGQQPNQ